MLHGISWKEFLTVLAAATLLYYLWLTFIYHDSFTFKRRPKLIDTNSPDQSQILPQGESLPQPDPIPHPDPALPAASRPLIIQPRQEDQPKRPNELAMELSEKIRQLLTEAGAAKLERGALLGKLNQLLESKPYKSLYDTPFKATLISQIRAETEHYCAIGLDAIELTTLWVT